MNPICIKHASSMELVDSLGNMCEACFVDASNQMIQNMGTPDFFYCGYCGSKCTQTELVNHVINKCYVELVNG